MYHLIVSFKKCFSNSCLLKDVQTNAYFVRQNNFFARCGDNVSAYRQPEVDKGLFTSDSTARKNDTDFELRGTQNGRLFGNEGKVAFFWSVKLFVSTVYIIIFLPFRSLDTLIFSSLLFYTVLFWSFYKRFCNAALNWNKAETRFTTKEKNSNRVNSLVTPALYLVTAQRIHK